MIHLAQTLGRGAMGLLYPPHCAACEAPLTQDELLCPACAAGLGPGEGSCCVRCGAAVRQGRALCAACLRAEALDGAVCFGRYEEGEPLTLLIHRLKYRGDRKLVPLLGGLLLEAALRLPRPQAVCFVPLVPRRRRARGFNQAELLARQVARALALPVRPLLRKTRDTLPQASLRRAERLVNLEGAFRAAPCTGARLWLVDDVRTTGATLEACARALKAGGAARVEGLVLAATPEA